MRLFGGLCVDEHVVRLGRVYYVVDSLDVVELLRLFTEAEGVAVHQNVVGTNIRRVSG